MGSDGRRWIRDNFESPLGPISDWIQSALLCGTRGTRGTRVAWAASRLVPLVSTAAKSTWTEAQIHLDTCRWLLSLSPSAYNQQRKPVQSCRVVCDVVTDSDINLEGCGNFSACQRHKAFFFWANLLSSLSSVFFYSMSNNSNGKFFSFNDDHFHRWSIYIDFFWVILIFSSFSSSSSSSSSSVHSFQNVLIFLVFHRILPHLTLFSNPP